MPDCGDDRDARTRYGPRYHFLIECPQVLDAPSPPANNEQIDLIPEERPVELADRRGNLFRRAHPLNTYRVYHNANPRGPPPRDVEKVADCRAR